MSDGLGLIDDGDEVAPGLHAGDRIKDRQFGHEYVSNFKPRMRGGRLSFVITSHKPEDWEPGNYAHGHWASPEEVELIKCPHPPPVTDEEVAELFGLSG